MPNRIDFEDDVSENDVVPEQQPVMPELVFEGIEFYGSAIIQAKVKLEELTNSGFMTVDVANRILGEYQYSFYQQFVKLAVK